MSKSSKSKIDFEKSLQTLESHIEKLEDGSLNLEQSLKYFEEGIKLIRDCQKGLKKAEQQVQMLVKHEGKDILEDFESEDLEEEMN